LLWSIRLQGPNGGAFFFAHVTALTLPSKLRSFPAMEPALV